MRSMRKFFFVGLDAALTYFVERFTREEVMENLA